MSMETREASDGTLVVSYDGTLLPKWLFGWRLPHR